ncbi:MAG: alpha/beta hydrolase [Runella sp.]
MKENHLEVRRTARYYTIGEWTQNTRQVWFVLHGYGQLARYFIKKFEAIANDETMIIAPEALSKLYLGEPGSSRVGASWLTREDRHNEIADQLSYFNTLFDTLSKGHNLEAVKINLLGFSQGTSAALRWLANGQVRFDKLVLWAGYFGNGIGDLVSKQQLSQVETVLAYGTQDQYLTQIDMKAYFEDILSVVPHVQIVSFDGPHTIDLPTLQKIVNS